MTDGKSKDKDGKLEGKVDGKKVRKLLENALLMGTDDKEQRKMMEGWVDKIFSDPPLEEKKSKS